MAKGKQPMMLPIYEVHSDIWCFNFRSFEEPVLEHIPIDTDPEKYELIKKGSKRGKDIVVSDHGFSFTFKEECSTYSTWSCTVRPKKRPCLARLRYQDGRWRLLGRHNHDGQEGLKTKILLTIKVHYHAQPPFGKMGIK